MKEQGWVAVRDFEASKLNLSRRLLRRSTPNSLRVEEVEEWKSSERGMWKES